MACSLQEATMMGSGVCFSLLLLLLIIPTFCHAFQHSRAGSHSLLPKPVVLFAGPPKTKQNQNRQKSNTGRLQMAGIDSSANMALSDENTSALVGWSTLEQAMSSSECQREDVVAIMEIMKSNGDINLWNSTFLYYQRYGVGDVRMLTRIRGEKDLIQTLGLDGKSDIDKIASILFAVIVGSILSSLTVLQNLPGPEIVRWSVTWLLAFAPYGYLALGLSFPAVLQRLLIQIFRAVDPAYRERLLYHEAGHFLVGYLVGMPVQSYSADAPINAVQFYPLAGLPQEIKQRSRNTEIPPDSAKRNAKEEEEMSIEKLRQLWTKINQDPNGPTRRAVEEGAAIGRRGALSLDQLQRLTVTSLAGVMAEVVQLGEGEGGYADLVQLQNFLYFCEQRLTDQQQQEYVRWGAVQAFTLLEVRRAELAALVEAFRRGASVPECLRVIEETHRQKQSSQQQKK